MRDVSRLRSEQSKIFARTIVQWVRDQADFAQTSAGSSDFGDQLVMLHEGVNVTLRCTSLLNTSISTLLGELEQNADAALCPRTKACSNTASICTDLDACAGSIGQRRLQQSATSALPPNLPAPPFWPALPASPPTPPYGLPSPTSPPLAPPLVPPFVYQDHVLISNDRVRNAVFSLSEQNHQNATVESLWADSFARSPLAMTHTIAAERTVVTKMGATVGITSVAQNESTAHNVATSTFDSMVANMSTLWTALSGQLDIEESLIEHHVLRVQYLHNEQGLVALELGDLPPPPLPLSLASVNASALTRQDTPVSQESVAQATLTVTTGLTVAVAASVMVSVAVSVTTAVASSVATATATAALGAAGGAAGSAAGSSSAAAGGSGGGAVMPLIFGAQRFGASAGLAAPKSEYQSSVAGAISQGPISGSFFSFASPPPPDSTDDGAHTETGELPAGSDTSVAGLRRRLQRGGGSSRQSGDMNASLGTLLAQVLSLLITLGTAASIMIVTNLIWKYWLNKKYYRQRNAIRHTHKDLMDLLNSKDLQDTKKAKFTALPGMLVFPSALYLIANFFATNAIRDSFAVLMESHESCDLSCRYPAFIVLLLYATYLSIVFACLLHFNYFHRSASWIPLEPPKDASDVEDPLYRLVSKIRVRLFGAGRANNIMDRPTGGFTRDPANMKEPRRTERLLSRPLSLFRSTPTDALDALKLVWLNQASGFSWRGVYYKYTLFVAQLLIGALSGIGPALEPGTAAANVQVCCTLGVQFGFALWCLLVKPSADRIETLEVGTQYAIEGIQTLVLLLQQFLTGTSSAEALQGWAYNLGLCALFLPITVQIYDAFIVQLSLLARRRSKGEEISCRSAMFALLALLLSIPRVIAAFSGFNLGDSVDAIGEATATFEVTLDEASCKVLASEFVEELDVATVIGVTNGLSDLASIYFWAAKPLPVYHRAAIQLQRHARGDRGRHKFRRVVEAARARKVDLPTTSYQERDRFPKAPRAPAVAWLEKQMYDVEVYHNDTLNAESRLRHLRSATDTAELPSIPFPMRRYGGPKPSYLQRKAPQEETVL